MRTLGLVAVDSRKRGEQKIKEIIEEKRGTAVPALVAH